MNKLISLFFILFLFSCGASHAENSKKDKNLAITAISVLSAIGVTGIVGVLIYKKHQDSSRKKHQDSLHKKHQEPFYKETKKKIAKKIKEDGKNNIKCMICMNDDTEGDCFWAQRGNENILRKYHKDDLVINGFLDNNPGRIVEASIGCPDCYLAYIDTLLGNNSVNTNLAGIAGIPVNQVPTLQDPIEKIPEIREWIENNQ